MDLDWVDVAPFGTVTVVVTPFCVSATDPAVTVVPDATAPGPVAVSPLESAVVYGLDDPPVVDDAVANAAVGTAKTAKATATVKALR